MSENLWTMTNEPLSPELALVDPDLAARARAALPQPTPAPAHIGSAATMSPRAVPPSETRTVRRQDGSHPYPLWARVTAALWLVVLGILIGGAAIPHAQDMPRVVPLSEEPPAVCTPSGQTPSPGVAPTGPGR